MSTPGPTIPPYVFAQEGTYNAPFTFQVPATLEIRPDTASATFDGTGAGADFLACLTFYDSAGNRLCRMFNPSPVTAGDVAEVTYIPPFGAAATSAPTPSGSGDLKLLYAFTITGSAQHSIDTDVDGPMAGLLPQNYSVLEVWFFGRDDVNSTGGLARFTFNNDTGNHYNRIAGTIDGSPPTTAPDNSVNQGQIAWNIPGATSADSLGIGMVRMSIVNYAQTTFAIPLEAQGGDITNVAAENVFTPLLANWRRAQALNRIKVAASGNLVVGSSLYVYGRT